MTKALRVGIIGASPARGWARESHVPAVQKLAGLELAGVAGRGQEEADAAAKAFGARRGFGDASVMVRDPEIDLVTIAVRVPSHRDLVLQALSAGKHVYCEWPLGRNFAEAEELASAARAARVHAAIGLQARRSPALRRARELITAGAIGRVLSARMDSGTAAFGPKTDKANLYLEDVVNGATLLTIHGGHALDAAIAVLGALEDVAALATTQFPEVEVADDGQRRARTVPDYVVTQSRLSAGGLVSVEVAGGRSADTTFRFEVVGDTGHLVLRGGAPRGFQSGRLALSLNGRPQQTDEGELASAPDTAANVGGVYAALRDDVLNGTFTVPDFGHAVRLTRLIEDLRVSSETGARKPAAHWPET